MIPAGRHDDWIWPLCLIPRRWTAFGSDIPPIKIIGTERAEDHVDIPERGKWVIAGVCNLKIPVYFAATSVSGLHFRIGLFRYDYVDHYYEFFSLTLKRLK